MFCAEFRRVNGIDIAHRNHLPELSSSVRNRATLVVSASAAADADGRHRSLAVRVLGSRELSGVKVGDRSRRTGDCC